jgi:hypothetical protein
MVESLGMEVAARRVPSLPSAFAPELRFLLHALRVRCGAADAAGLRGMASGIDWNIAVAALEYHGVLALLAPLLLREGDLPAERAALLRQAQARNAAASLRRIGHTLEVTRALRGAGVRFLVLKGIPLSAQLYGDPAARGGRDLDIFVAEGMMPHADAVLAALGYRRPTEDMAKDIATDEVPKEIGYLHPDGRVLVELHNRLTDNARLLPWDFEMLWAEREIVAVGGESLAAMPRTRLAPYLCIHGARSGWARLIWLLDMAAATGTPEAAAQALADARSLGLEGAMRHAFSMLRRWLGQEVPDASGMPPAMRAQVRALDALARRFYDSRWYEPPARNSWRRFRRGSLLSRSISYLIKLDGRYWRRELAREAYSSADRTLIALPKPLAWLYLPLRPFGWLIRRVRRARP